MPPAHRYSTGRCCVGNLKTEPATTQEPRVSDWLTPKDLQHELRIGEKLAYKLLKSGEIPSVRVGGLIRIYRPHLEEALLEDPELGEEKRPGARRQAHPDPAETTTLNRQVKDRLQ
jgi:excisionase family DNA binding protein